MVNLFALNGVAFSHTFRKAIYSILHFSNLHYASFEYKQNYNLQL